MRDMTAQLFNSLNKVDARLNEMNQQGIDDNSPEKAQVIQDGKRLAELIREQEGIVKPEKIERTLGSAAADAIPAMPQSLLGVGSDIVEAVTSPIETGKGIVKALSGGLQNLLGDDISNFINEKGQVIGLGDDSADREVANAIGKHFSDKYGSEENILRTLATDPASMLLDVSALLTGGGSILAKAGKVGNISKVANVGEKLKKAASYVDPLSLTAKGATLLAKGGTYGGKHMAGRATGVGVTPLEQAYKSGKTGGDIQKQFLANLKGEVPMRDAVDIARKNLNSLKEAKQAKYRSNELLWKSDKQTLSFKSIDDSIAKANSLGEWRGKVYNQKTVDVIDGIKKDITAWKKHDKSFHTPEGLDKLKQQVWSNIEKLDPMKEGRAYGAAMGIYNGIKKTISDQAPSYSRAMKEYSEATDIIHEITKTLSLGSKSKTLTDTSLRKLQSLMRDNVNTNYGERAGLADELVAAGKDFRPALAGQALKEPTPRGIAGALQYPTNIGAGVTGAAMGGIPGAAATTAASMAMQSPRIMGGLSNISGQVMKSAKDARNTVPMTNEGIQGLLNFLYQTQQFQEDK